MDIKAFLRDPPGFIADMALNPKDSDAQKLLTQAEEIKTGRKRLKQLKKEKSAVASQFKALEVGSLEHTSLVDRMQAVSEAYNAQEASIKTLEKALRERLETLEQDKELEPPFFRVPLDRRYSGGIDVRELRSDEMPLWFDFLSRQRNVPAYCHPAWSNVIQSAFSNPTRVWTAFSEDGEILGGVPLTLFDSQLFGRFAVSVPYFNYGAVLTPYINVMEALFEHLKQVCESERLSHVEVRTMQPGLGFPSISKKASMVLQLPETEQALEGRLSAKVRAQCKKADPFRPQARFGGEELLDDFYHVFAVNMRDLGTPVYSKRWFREILGHPDIAATLVVVYVSEKPVSTGFLVGHNGMLEIPWASTVKNANVMDTNMWMYRRILDFAIRKGYEFFDFGRSTRDAGTYRFKKQWGANPHEHHWYYITPDNSKPPELSPDNPKFRLMIALWKRMPVWLSRLVGPPIVKHLP